MAISRSDIDEVLHEVIQNLLDKGARREDMELACAGAMITLKSDFFRSEKQFKDRVPS